MKAKAEKKISEKKQVLIKLSKTVKAQMDLGQLECSTINEGIMQLFYRQEGNEEFHTFKQWKEQGYKVVKGSTSFPVWAKPRKVEKTEEKEGETFEEKYSFFPIAHLFSNKQVEKIQPTNA